MNDLQKWRSGIAWLAMMAGMLFVANTSLLRADPLVYMDEDDDDGIINGIEDETGTLSLRSESPYVMRTLEFTGGDCTVVDPAGSYAVSNWTVEAWVRPTNGVSGFVPLVSRRATGSPEGADTTFEVGLFSTNGETRAYTRINRQGWPAPFVLTGGQVPLNGWTHLAATFASSTALKPGLFILYMNGFEAVRGQNQYLRPVTPLAGTLYMGASGFQGQMMEIRIWRAARTPVEIYNNFRRLLLFSTDARENNFQSSSGTYCGRPTVAALPPTPSEDGFVVRGPDPTGATTVPFQRHTFAIEAYVQLQPGSIGGIIARRKVDLGGLVIPADDRPFSEENAVVGDDDPLGPWGVCESLEVTGDGALQAQWWGIVTHAPVAYGDRLARRFLKSDLDLRDGKWHHVAVVGNGINVALYVDGVLDSKNLTYYRVVNPPTVTVTRYAQFDDLGTVLRIGQGGFDGVIDEVMFWNDWLTQAEIIRHKTYGLTLGEVAAQINYYNFAGGVVPFNPLPLPPLTPAGTAVAATGPGGTGVRHKRLVSYVVFDGTPQQATFVADLANAAVPYRILPLPTGLEIVSVGRPPIAVDGLGRTFGSTMPGYFACSDGGLTVENYMLRNYGPAAGVFSPGAGFSPPLDKTDPVATEFLIMDSDSDGMPDWWETANGTDQSAPDADTDLDGDGLSNITEYQAGTHPFDPDSNSDGVTDDAEDPDHDGLTNIQEQNVTHTHSGLYDTDDDGFSDGEEVRMGSDPLNAYSPSRPGAYEFNGGGRLRLHSELIGKTSLASPETVTDLSRSWTVEAWVQPANGTVSGVVARRWAQYSGGASNWLQYELGLTNGVPYIEYQSARSNQVLAVAASDSPLGTNWTHVAGVLDLNGSQLRLYVDGMRVANTVAQPVPQILYDAVFETTIGGGDLQAGVVSNGFSGKIDAVRMWAYVRSGYELQQAAGVLLPEFAGATPDASRAPKRIFNFDDCSTGPTTNSLHAQNSYYTNDWAIGWAHAANVEGAPGGAVWVSSPFPPLDLDSDDDGLADVDEMTRNWNIYRSESPLLNRYVHFANGIGDVNTVLVDEQVDAEETGIYALKNWTVEAWVRPTNVTAGALVPLVRRMSKTVPWMTFEIGLTNASGRIRPYALFDRDDAQHARVMLIGNSAPFDLRTGTNAAAWNHLAATFSSDRFSLFIDGNQVALSQVIGAGPVGSVGGEVMIGSPGFEGDMREVRIWKVPRTPEQIADSYRKTLLFSPALQQNIYNAKNNAYLGRATQTDEDGYIYDRSEEALLGGLPYQQGLRTHKFTLEAWVKMDRGAAGGIVAERKIDVNLLPDVADWRINHSLRITADGQPQAVWQGQVTVVTPVYVPPANVVLARLNQNQEIITRNLTSEVDIRDGTWHHLALVGDSVTITLYIDGVRDTEKPYYTFMARAAPTFESFFFTYPPINSVLRVADDGIQAQIDEVLYWNEDITEEALLQHMNLGLNQRDIRQGLLDIAPVPAFAQGTGHHQRLVSYLTFDGSITPPWIVDDANNTLPYRMLPQPVGNEIIVNARPPVNVDRLRGFSGQLAGYFAAVDGGNRVENYMARNDWGYAGVLQSGVEFRESSTDGAPAFAVGDADGDGLPDWWEVEYGLDPGLADGADGSYGDPDGDGLPNVAELQAGTSPLEPDTDHDGIADFFSWDITGTNQYRIYGERFADFDGMPDDWETAHRLNPTRYDAQEDADGDGWDNGSESAAGTDPEDNRSYPKPLVRTTFKYTGSKPQGVLVVHAYSTPAMDGVPDAIGTSGESVDIPWQWLQNAGALGIAFEGALTSVPIVPASVRIGIGPRGDEIIFEDQGNGVLRSIGVTPERFGTIDYETGEWSLSTSPRQFGPESVIWGSWSVFVGIESYPFEGPLAFSKGHLRKGPAWFFAFIDADPANGIWDPGEPAGVAEYQPISVNWGEVKDVVFGLTENQPRHDSPTADYQLAGYGRFAWPAFGNSSYRVYIRDAAGREILQREMLGPRTYFHEGDYRLAGVQGLPLTSTYQWFVYVTNVTSPYVSGSFTVAYPPVPQRPTPVAVAPMGAILQFARNDLVWKSAEAGDTGFRVQISPEASFADSSKWVFNRLVIPPFREKDGTQRLPLQKLQLYAGYGAFTNGTYYWRVQGWNPVTPSGGWAAGSFAVQLSDTPAGPYSISGQTLYWGKVTNSAFVVEAYTSPGFGGDPEARIRVDNHASSNWWPRNPTDFSLQGLPRGTYYVRGFLDQNNSQTLENWETRGFVGADAYTPLKLELPNSKTQQQLNLMIADTDNDRIADDWEYQYFGNLTAMGPGPLRGYTDTTGLGVLNDYERYAYTPMNISPFDLNPRDVDGVPLVLKKAFGLDLYAPIMFKIDNAGVDGARRPIVAWKGVAVAPGEVRSAGLGVQTSGSHVLRYQIQYSPNLQDWSDVQTGGVLVYDVVKNEFRFVDQSRTNGPAFYRLHAGW